jgi:hypothetical protein
MKEVYNGLQSIIMHILISFIIDLQPFTTIYNILQSIYSRLTTIYNDLQSIYNHLQ